MTKVYLGLGSNLAEPIKQLDEALKALEQIPQTKLGKCSSYYKSQPMGPSDQPDFVNAVALLETEQAPLTLLKYTQHIELAQGRVRKAQQWGPRTLDIDILLYGNQQLDYPELVVPHYGMGSREFVLYPLLEISPDLTLPSGERLSALVKRCPLNDLQVIDTSVG